MSGAVKATSNKWMVDLATSAKQEVNAWPAWKKESFGIVELNKSGAATRSGKGAQLEHRSAFKK